MPEPEQQLTMELKASRTHLDDARRRVVGSIPTHEASADLSHSEQLWPLMP